MKLIHLSDLHLGKRLYEFSLMEDQRYVLMEQILPLIDEEKPQAVLIAGDVYDKSIPNTEAIQLFDEFLNRLSVRNLTVCIISGNHDSPERMAFGSRLMESSQVYFSPVYDGSVQKITLEDAYGKLHIHLLPFLKPVHVRRWFPEAAITSYNAALQTVVSSISLNTAERNILMTHQLITGASRSDSEEITIGGLDHVEAEVFRDFDYVALGHIHRPQQIQRKTVRYCGTPLKYSFSEASHEKSVTVVEMGDKGDVQIRTRPLVPLRDMKEISGKYEEIIQKSYYENTTLQEDFLHITLTDEEDISNAVFNLRKDLYPYLLKLDYNNKRTRQNQQILGDMEVRKKDPLELFAEFYALQNNQPMNQEQQELMHKLVETIWEEE